VRKTLPCFERPHWLGNPRQFASPMAGNRVGLAGVTDAHEIESMLFDLEPVGDDVLSNAVIRLVDGVILIIDAAVTRPSIAQPVVGVLRSAGVTILGAVLTNRRYPVPGSIYQRL